jgi:hypothetical protein
MVMRFEKKFGNGFKFGRQGQIHWSFLAALLLGLAGMVLIFFFLFDFGDDTLDWENCRQSIFLRANLPEVNTGSITWSSLKDKFPLKCKTQVVNIDFKDDNERAEKVIADTIASCWSLFGEGSFNIFSSDGVGFHSVCVPCARIHFDPKYIDYYNNNPVSINNALRKKFKGGTYLDYLNRGKGTFPAMSFGSREFDIDSNDFSIGNSFIDVTFVNRITHKTEVGFVADIHLPRSISPSDGDLIINYGSSVSSFSGDIGNYIPYIFYYRTRSDSRIYGDLKNKVILDGFLKFNAEMCNDWEGIPA